jgi:hypothetical protein
MLPKHIKQIQRRAHRLNVRQVGRQTIMVDSATEAPGRHAVTIRYDGSGNITAYCTCNWSNHNGVACSHVMAALDMIASKKGKALSFWLTEDDARRQRHKRFFLSRGGEAEGVWVTSRPLPRETRQQRVVA